MAHIKIKNLTVRFSYHRENSIKNLFINTLSGNDIQKKTFTALLNIEFEANDGDRIGIIGHNGAGKSTLLKVIAGIYTGYDRFIVKKGTIVPSIELGGATFIDQLSVDENIKLTLAYYGIDAKEYNFIKHDVLNFSELNKFKDTPIKYLSSGMISRLSFSIAMNVKSDILLLDEFLIAGDQKFINKSQSKLLEKINQSKLTIVTSHNVDLLKKVCNKIYFLEKGKIISSGNPETIIDEYLKTCN